MLDSAFLTPGGGLLHLRMLDAVGALPGAVRRYGSLLAWLVFANVVGYLTYGFGLSTFLCLLAMTALLAGLRHGAPRAGRPRGAGASSPWPGRLTAVALAAAAAVTAHAVVRSFTVDRDWVQDIGANTQAAAEVFLDGRNPYSERTQLRHDVPPDTPGVAVADGTLTMDGVPYHYGYPYFPVTFLAYAPLVAIVPGPDALRLANLLLLAANLAAMGLLVRRLAPPGDRAAPALVAFTAYLGVLVYGREIFVLGLVDILYSTFILYAFLALAHGRHGLAGVLLGLLQGAKLLPGPFVAAAVVLALASWSDRRRVLVGYLGTSLLVIVPFAAAAPGNFLSATILYYLTYHAGGDDTSLWYALPSFLKGVFLVGGIVASVGVLGLLARPGRGRVVDAMLAAFAGYTVFMAFSRMTHLNYLWSVLPLGCVLLALLGSPERPVGGADA